MMSPIGQILVVVAMNIMVVITSIIMTKMHQLAHETHIPSDTEQVSTTMIIN